MSRTTLPAVLAASWLALGAAAAAQEQDEQAVEGDAAESAAAQAAEETGADTAEDAAGEGEAAETASDETASDETAPDETDEAGEAVDPAILAALEAGDAQSGENVYRLCMACHTLDEGAHRVGPSLYGIIGRTAGTIEGFRYSPANRDSAVTWTEANLFVYLENPQAFIPRTIMAFPGLRTPEQRADVIAYMRENGGLAVDATDGEASDE
ncbi:MAG: cytochrome c family protein [Caulobacterales bacterium]|nr:cytochrome c family protein [Caulobacterales bacterium]